MNPPQPPVPQPAASGETVAIEIACKYFMATDPERVSLTKDIAAAVQAESRKLLERLKEKRDTCYDCVHEDEDLNNQPFVPVTAIDAELARLDSEQQKLGGK